MIGVGSERRRHLQLFTLSDATADAVQCERHRTQVSIYRKKRGVRSISARTILEEGTGILVPGNTLKYDRRATRAMGNGAHRASIDQGSREQRV